MSMLKSPIIIVEEFISICFHVILKIEMKLFVYIYNSL
jgi:hypothetical protein